MKKERERRACPYHYCRAHILLVGPAGDPRLRSHQYEGVGPCPGSGYHFGRPAAVEQRAMEERERALFVRWDQES